MRRFDGKVKSLAFFLYRWIEPIADPVKLKRSVPAYVGFFRDWWSYSTLAGAEEIRVRNVFPQLHDKTETTPYDAHYFYQNIWAFKKIAGSKTTDHIDVGSQITFISYLTAVCNVTFVDIRPLVANLENYQSRAGSILAMPFGNDSVGSLSCLHVAEHIGLGRYGDPLDPLGTKKACRELSRILAKGGDLYFSLPVGRARLCFNAHRVHSPTTILEYFSDLDLIELSCVSDQREFVRDVEVDSLEKSTYACGMFHFRKPQTTKPGKDGL